MIFYEAWWSGERGVSMGEHGDMVNRRQQHQLGFYPEFITSVTVEDWWEGQRELNKILIWDKDNCPGVKCPTTPV